MKIQTRLLLAGVCSAALSAAVIHAQSGRQPQPYKVVFDLTSDDPLDQRALLRWLGEIAVANPETEMEVVMYRAGTRARHAGSDRATLTTSRRRWGARTCRSGCAKTP